MLKRAQYQGSDDGRDLGIGGWQRSILSHDKEALRQQERPQTKNVTQGMGFDLRALETGGSIVNSSIYNWRFGLLSFRWPVYRDVVRQQIATKN